jgi:MYXO-CTERM domain-containing protein
MSLSSRNSARRALFVFVGGLLAVGVGHATTLWNNPFETAPGNLGLTQSQLDHVQSQTVYSFTASQTGTLQGYFAGGWSPASVGFQNSVGVYLGQPTTSSAAATAGNSVFGSLNATPSINNRNATFGQALFGTSGISVTQGQTISFVLLANQTYNSCCSPPSANNSPHYVWSNESTKLTTTGYSATYAASSASPTPSPSGYNAMAWSTNVTLAGAVKGADASNSPNCATNPQTGYTRDCVPTGRNGTVAAGSYTYVGFNDWLAGNSNSYDDFSFLFNITPSCTGPSCGSGSVPEPGTFALAAFALAGVVGARRRWPKARAI